MESPLCSDLTPGLRVIETLRWDRGFARLPQHLARLERTCAALSFPFDPATVASAMAGVAGASPLRVRLTVGQAGDAAVTVAPLTPAPTVWRIALAQARLNSADPWLAHKTTRRAAYDDARAALPEGLDEVIFLNERGEVCEGTITTVFADTGAGMVTPPLTSGLLPGVLRAELLASGTCREEVLRAPDLAGARLWVGNALRGLIAARWMG